MHEKTAVGSPQTFSISTREGLGPSAVQRQQPKTAPEHDGRPQLQPTYSHGNPRDSPDYEPYQLSQTASESEDLPEPDADPESDKEAGEIDDEED